MKKIGELISLAFAVTLIVTGAGVIGTVVAEAFGLDSGQQVALIGGISVYGCGIAFFVDWLRS